MNIPTAGVASAMQSTDKVSEAERVVNHTRVNLDRAHLCRENLTTLRDKLLGGRPQDPTNKQPSPQPCGLLPILSPENEHLNRVLEDMMGMLVELNKAI